MGDDQCCRLMRRILKLLRGQNSGLGKSRGLGGDGNRREAGTCQHERPGPVEMIFTHWVVVSAGDIANYRQVASWGLEESSVTNGGILLDK